MRWQNEDSTWWAIVAYAADQHSSQLENFAANRVRVL
jgi:hypothetical protein